MPLPESSADDHDVGRIVIAKRPPGNGRHAQHAEQTALRSRGHDPLRLGVVLEVLAAGIIGDHALKRCALLSEVLEVRIGHRANLEGRNGVLLVHLYETLGIAERQWP